MQTKIPQELQARLKFDKPHTEVGEPAQLVKIEYAEHPCIHCGVVIEQEKYTVRKYQSPRPHWRKSCENCKLWMDPTTGKYSLTTHEANSLFRELFCKKK